MLVDKSTNIFWNMIKNKKDNRKKDQSSMSKKKRGSFLIEQQCNQIGEKEEPMKLIEKMPTYSKISILQGLLKEMTSTKERFEDNKNNLLNQIKNNCYEYYKNKIGMKEIYDYCLSNHTENHVNYTLVENIDEKIRDTDKYDIICKVIFLLRNNNDIMLNIIKNCPEDSFDQFTDFLVNYFYENTIDCSFSEEELLVIIYLIIEEYILNKLLKTIYNNNNNSKSKNTNYKKETILYHIFKSLTRKPDVRNFTCSVLSESILKLEGYNIILSIESKILVNNFILEKKSQIGQSCTYNDIDYHGHSFDENSTTISKEYSKTFSESNILFNKYDDNLYYENEEKLNLDNIELNPCFSDNDVTLLYLKEKLSEYEQKNSKDYIVIAMKQFINNQINKINKENSEIFSNNIRVKSLQIYGTLNGKENLDILTDILMKNYVKLTDFISEVLHKLKENITSLPYIMKSINTIINLLINKKYENEKPNDLEFHQFMVLTNFLIGNIILPLISNPDFNGIITTCVISKITKDNLEIITKIIQKMISGNLFSNKTDSEYTIFNKYIINTLPKIFEIIRSLNSQTNFKLPNIINNLFNTNDSIGKPNRNINYNYFNENQQNIQYQSICFSWLDLVILINLVRAYKDSENKDEYNKYSQMFDEFIGIRDYCVNKYNDELINNQRDFFIFEKINYSPYFSQQMENILEDNYLSLMQNKDKDDENILLFKKCLVEVLSYVNKLHKESFNYFVQKNHENLVRDNDIILLLANKKLYNTYLGTQFENDGKKTNIKKNSHKNSQDLFKISDLKGLEENENEDADFREVIFPQLIDTIKYELGHNLDSDKSKRILFCSSFLQIHIDDLPEKYKENNYSLLILEIIKKHEIIINELNFSIINQFYLKVKEGQKLNMIILNNYLQIKEMEKCICIEYLFDKLILPCKLSIKKDGMGNIKNVIYEAVEEGKTIIQTIQNFIDNFPDFRKYADKVDDIIDLEEKIELDATLNAYFKDLRALAKKEKIIARFSTEEFEFISYELENYILFKLYDKLFPAESSKTDKKFYKKCCRLDFVKPENLIKDKKMINEKLWETSMVLIDEMDAKLTPADKVKNFGKAFGILQNSITFCSGKNELGIDDTISTLIYVILKSKPKNIFSNSKYCQLFLNPELAKKQYGILLSQIEMIKNIIYDMKYTDLIGVTEKEFGKDED